MTWQTQEESNDSSVPIELFMFEGTLLNYYFTSSAEAYIYSGQTYSPIAISRSQITMGDITEKNELKINLPIDNDLVADYLFNIAPNDLVVTIYRAHPDTGNVSPWFKGQVTSGAIKRGLATLVVPSVFTQYMSAEFPNIYYQAQCNHPLFSSRCTLLRSAFSFAGTVESMVDRHNISVLAAADKAEGYYNAGEIMTATERRLIVSHVGAQLKINYPFRSLSVEDAVTLVAGCDHTIETCRAKFNNDDNFLGFPYTPGVNPFKTGISS